MIPNALLITLAVLLGSAFYLMGELRFLVPYRVFLFHEYGWALAIFFGGLLVNVFAGIFVLIRKFLLKDTGRKLSHIDKQFQFRSIEPPFDERN
jgi:hypothetical protein